MDGVFEEDQIRRLARDAVTGDLPKKQFSERMRAMSPEELRQLAAELRRFVERVDNIRFKSLPDERVSAGLKLRPAPGTGEFACRPRALAASSALAREILNPR